LLPNAAQRFTMTSRVLRGFVGFLFLIAAFIGSAAPAFDVKRPLSYSVIPLGTPGTEEAWSPNFFYPEYINNKGDVVGSRGSGVVFYRDGAIHELGYPRAPLEPGWTSGLNDRGEILGCAFGESTGVFILPSRPGHCPFPTQLSCRSRPLRRAPSTITAQSLDTSMTGEPTRAFPLSIVMAGLPNCLRSFPAAMPGRPQLTTAARSSARRNSITRLYFLMSPSLAR
jgi:hypothetical protein